MIKNDDLLALPRAAKPAKAMRAAQEHARPAGEPGNVPRQTPREYAGPCTAPGVICAKVHETADGPVLALDLWARGGLYAREFFDGQGKRRINDKGPFQSGRMPHPCMGIPGRRKTHGGVFQYSPGNHTGSGGNDLPCRAWPARR